MTNLRNPCPPIRTTATKAHWMNPAPQDRPNRPNLTVRPHPRTSHRRASRPTSSTPPKWRNAQKVPSCRSRKRFVFRPRTGCTTTLAVKASGGFPMGACLGCATGAIATPSSTPARSCWTICRCSTSTRKRDRLLASGMVARCTTKSRAADGGWNGTCFHMVAPNRTSALWRGAGCDLDRR